MKILVTGSTGFVGKFLVNRLLENSYEILEVTRSIEKSTQIYGDKTKKVQITKDQELLRTEISNFEPEIVLHLAAFISSRDDYETVVQLTESNVLFLVRLLDALSDTKIKLFVNTGTFAEYQNGDGVLNPAYAYAATKIAARSFIDYYSNIYKFKQINVIPYTIYGGKSDQKKIIDLLFESTKADTSLNLSPGEQVLDFIHIDDLVDLYVSIIENEIRLPVKSEIFAGTGTGISIKNLAKLITEVTVLKTNVNWGGLNYRERDVMYAVAQRNEINYLINWTSKIDIETGLQRYIKSKSKS